MRTGRLSYKWIIAAACFGMVFICDGFAAGYRGLFLTAVSDGLGIKRTLVAIGESCRFLAGAGVSVFYGPLTARFSAKRLITFGFLVLIGSLLLFSCTRAVYTFWAAGVLMGVGMSFISSTMASSLIRQWFDKNVGSVTGVVLAASGVGSALGSQIISPILYSGDPDGFRTAYRITALVVAVVAAVLIPLLRENRQNTDSAQKPSPDKVAVKKNGNKTEAERSVYVIAGCVFFCAASIMGVNSIYASHMLDMGVSAEAVGTAAGILSLTLIGSKLLTGVLFDKLGLRPVLGICQVATLVAFGMLLILKGNGITALIFPAVFAVALPLETIMIPLIVSDTFGREVYNKYLGIFTAVTSAGFTVAAPLSNLIFDACGSYKPAIWGYGFVMILVSVILHITITLKKRSDSNANK